MRDRNLIKGDYLTIDEKCDSKVIYFYPKHDKTSIEDSDEKLSEVEHEVISLTAYERCEFEGEILQVYKNNLVVSIENQYKEYVNINEVINIRIVKKEDAYECSLKVLGIKDEIDKLIIVLSIPVIEKKVDRRRFFRLAVKFGIRYCVLPKGKYSTITDVPPGCFLKIKKTLSHDISAGGISIIVDENFDIGAYVLVCVYLPNKIDILCQVVRATCYEDTKRMLISMKFVYIHELDRDKVAAFVIKNEIYRRNKAKQNNIN